MGEVILEYSRQFRRKREGFTIVELLIVIVVIGILAALVLNSFSGAQGKANDVSVQNDLKNIAKKVLEYQANNGRFPETTELSATNIRVNKSAYATYWNLYYCKPTGQEMFSLTAESKSGNRFYLNSTNLSVRPYEITGWLSANICPYTGMSDTTHQALYNAGTGSWLGWVGE